MDRLIECCFCDSRLKGDELRLHFQKIHKIQSKSNIKKEFLCKICSKRLSSIDSFLSHIDVIHKHSKSPDSVDDGLVPSVASQLKIPHKNWSPSSISFAPEIAKMIAELRFSTTVTRSELGNFVRETEELLKNCLAKCSAKVKEFFDFKNYSADEKDLKSFFEQFE